MEQKGAPQVITFSRGRARIGVVVPVSNCNLEPDMTMMRPSGVSLHFMRAGGYDLDRVPDSDQMRKFAEAGLEEVIAGLATARVDFVLYGCTSATLAHGLDFDRDFEARITHLAGVRAVTAAGALVEALTDLGVSKVGSCSPYTRRLNAEGAAFLEEAGFEVVSQAYVGEDLGNYGQSDMTPEAVFRLGLEADRADAEAVVLSCTDMRALEAIATLEEALQKPVVTSNQALMYVARKRLDLVDEANPVPGALGGARPAPGVQPPAK
jgi:maleate isomerase/arylmalonate decarboxylase